MRQLLPTPRDDVDAYEAYRPPPPSKPSLRCNMVASLDGAVLDEHGRAGGLGSAADREVFRVLRAHADAILVGAGTVRTEGYGPHRLRSDLAARRRADGHERPAPIVVVSRSLDLDPEASLFREAETATVVITCASAPRERRAALERCAHVLVVGDEQVDVGAGLGRLRAELGVVHVLCEGGPVLNSELFGTGLVDELCMTVAPALLDGDGPRAAGHLGTRVELALLAAFEHEGELLLRYAVRESAG